jgi:hypothetical protein
MTWSEGTADGERLAVPRTDGVTLRMRRRTRVTLASVRSLCECAPKKGRPSVALQAKLLLKHEWIVKAVAHVDHKKNEKALKASPDWPELFGVPIGERRVAPCSGCGCVTPCDSFSRATWMWTAEPAVERGRHAHARNPQGDAPLGEGPHSFHCPLVLLLPEPARQPCPSPTRPRPNTVRPIHPPRRRARMHACACMQACMRSMLRTRTRARAPMYAFVRGRTACRWQRGSRSLTQWSRRAARARCTSRWRVAGVRLQP